MLIKPILDAQKSEKIIDVDLQKILTDEVVNNIERHEEKIVQKMVIYYSRLLVEISGNKNYIVPACPNNYATGWASLTHTCRLALYRNLVTYTKQRGVQ